jgi:hypothetical protein
MALKCLVTIHGIGFQQPPQGGNPGYADDLHSNLAGVLGPALGDDPQRPRGQVGDAGPVYVESEWPLANTAIPSVEEGLKRLGSWDSNTPGKLLPQPPPLVANAGSATVAHVALVYSHLEFVGTQATASLEAAAQAALSLAHYEPVRTLAHSLFLDAKALLRHPPQRPPAPLSLRPRTDIQPTSQQAGASPTQPSGILATLRQLEDDVAAYVTRNYLRERVRDFVTEALLRIAAREDIETIVVNSHSQGTVVSFDVLRNVPDSTSRKVKWHYVTAGSPLRKYRDLFSWGDEVADIHGVEGWTNYYDDSDPVADPLAFPNPAEITTSPLTTLFQWTDPESGSQVEQPVHDIKVDNLANCVHPGGLQAHNYWDNLPEFIGSLARILT